MRDFFKVEIIFQFCVLNNLGIPTAMQMFILKKSFVSSIYYFITNTCFIRPILFAERNLIWLRNFLCKLFSLCNF